MPVALQPKGSENNCFPPKTLHVRKVSWPDFLQTPQSSSVLHRRFTLHTRSCQTSKLKQNVQNYPVALLVWEDCSQFSRKPFSLSSPISIVCALKAHWKAALSRCECVWNAAAAVVCHLARAFMQQTVPLQHWPELGVQIPEHSSGEGQSNAGGRIQWRQSQTQRHFWTLHMLLIMTTLRQLATKRKCMLWPGMWDFWKPMK